MKVLLMHPDRDFDPAAELPAQYGDLRQDLELDRLLEVMAHGDDYLYKICEHGVLNGISDPEVIRYRQGALSDCLEHTDTVIKIYNVVFAALAEERKHWLYSSRVYRPSADRLIDRSITLLTAYLDALVEVRDLAAAHRGEFSSAAFEQLFATTARELGDDYIATVAKHLKQCRFARGIHFSARIEKGCGSTDYVLRTPVRQGLVGQLGTLLDNNSHTFRIPDRDEAGFDALAAIRGRGIMEVAESLNRSCEHVTAFLRQLRAELGFYIGCVHLRRELDRRGEPTCLPDPIAASEPTLICRDLYDPCLALSVDGPVVGNDVDAAATTLLVITGANQGGKSTFLRSIGLAQLMMQAGMFVPANAFRANTRGAVFTHFKREEDATMTHGKFDEELVRMSRLIDRMPCDALLLCNESFAATNEREGSAIARDIIAALGESGVQICYVTHMYDLASSLYERHDDAHLFLRAERRDDGSRSFRLVPAPPLPTSYGEDLYQRVFAPDSSGSPPRQPHSPTHPAP